MPNYGTGVIATPAAAAAAAYCTFHTLAITNYKLPLGLFIKNNNLAI